MRHSISIFFLLACGCLISLPVFQIKALEIESNSELPTFDVDSFKSKCIDRLNRGESLGLILNNCSEVLKMRKLEGWPEARLLMWRAYLYTQKNSYGAAYYDFKAALALMDNREEYRKYHVYCASEGGELATRLGAFQQASILFETALLYANKEDSAVILSDFALAKKAQGEYAQAQEMLNMALKVNSNKAFDFYILGNKIDLFIELSQQDSVQFLLDHIKRRKLSLSKEDQIYLKLYEAQYDLLNKEFDSAQNRYLALIKTNKQAEIFSEIELPLSLGLVESYDALEKYHENYLLLKQLIGKYRSEKAKEELSPKLLELYSWHAKTLSQLKSGQQKEFDQCMAELLDVVVDIKLRFIHREEKKYLATYLKEILETAFEFYAKNEVSLEGQQLRNLVMLNESVRAIRLKERMRINRLGRLNELFLEKQKEIDERSTRFEASDVDANEKLNLNLQLEKLEQQLSMIGDSLAPFTRHFLSNSTRLYHEDSTCYLAYFTGSKAVYSLQILKQRGKVSRIQLSPEKLMLQSDELYDYILTRNQAYYPLSYELFQKLWPKDIQSSRVVILADQTLFKIPFEALLTDTISLTSFLLNNYSISYSYTLLQSNEGATVQLNKSQFIHHSFENNDRFSYIPPNKNPAHLLERVSYQYSKQTDDGRTQFLHALQENDFVHLTTHGSFDGENVKLFFENGDSLEISKLYQQRYQANLVVLNACRSGRGKSDVVEGAIHFAYPLLYGGCSNVSVNLWESNLEITQQITANFLTSIKNSYLSSSLRNAKLAFLRDEETTQAMQHPYFWASSVLYSQTDAKVTLERESTSPFFLIVGLLVVLSMIILLVYQKVNVVGISKIGDT